MIAIPSRSIAIALAALLAGAASANDTHDKAGQGARSSAQSNYQAERAACMNGQTNQDRQTCLREAGAALVEARRGGLSDKGADYDRNKLARCDAQTVPADREMCIRMMKGEGTSSGSVEGGGIYRELVVTQPAGS